MKKILLFFFVALMAVGMSAFTADTSADVYYKLPGSEELHPTVAQPCPIVGPFQCTRQIPEENNMVLPIFDANGNSYLRN
jgi:hypothetical protein